ncbi:hypothetical protein VCRA2128O305_40215 [Vibrio crassostreae]|uniref:Uncharacterized protein n=1 Tax=Vibrio crassostreae TaxID=246167 RepID=A0A822MZ48_9VIBR|nr:hypothetical protein VCRA2112O187_160002 [Vibrio crassostreae]CAK1937306.1 hypothetical protein VCRA2113O206_260003 [Vibrio crassostreae]CAK1982131.1 hypothetical protein VCRA2118O239_20128 [Vibrio crassostreae]CAK2014573.1 hypothetical protein VCRA2113O204_20287 [Vibrio crassostreae]CAK2084133.1 hypothetical protein VCRA2110O173_30287 [Vibrio crassostreae]
MLEGNQKKVGSVVHYSQHTCDIFDVSTEKSSKKLSVMISRRKGRAVVF